MDGSRRKTVKASSMDGEDGASGSGAVGSAPEKGAAGVASSSSRRGSLKRGTTSTEEHPFLTPADPAAALAAAVRMATATRRGRSAGPSRSLGSSRKCSPSPVGGVITTNRGRPVSPDDDSNAERVFRDIVDADKYRKPKPKAPEEEEGGLCDADKPLAEMGKDELLARAREVRDSILIVSRGSSNLHGPYKRKLNVAASAVLEITELLATRTPEDEARRNRANELRLERLLELAMAERQAYKEHAEKVSRELATHRAEARGDVPKPASLEPNEIVGLIGEAVEQRVGQATKSLVETLERTIAVTAGNMVKAHIAGIEDRLLPEKVIRPPLAADARRAGQQAFPALPSRPAVAQPAPRTAAPQSAPRMAAPQTMSVPRPAAPRPAPSASGPTGDPVTIRPPKMPRLEASGPKAQRAPRTEGVQPSQADPSPDDLVMEYEPLPGPSTEEGTWATVVGRRARARANKAARAAAQQSQPTPAAAAPVVKKAPAKKGPKLVPPKTAAVVVRLRPEAEAKGTSYRDIMESLVKTSTLADLDLAGQVKVRPTMAGARIFELAASHSGKAAELAAKMAVSLNEVAVVVQPVKTADIRVTELDDSANKATVEAAIVAATGCHPERVKALEVRLGPGGMGTTIVSCPVACAKQLAERGRVFIGWTSAKVVALEPRPLRCFRCMGIGHTRPTCPSPKAREKVCFRCGAADHLIEKCTAAAFRCAVCADSGRRSDHLMGGRACFPPMMKGKPAAVTPPRTGAAAVAATAAPAGVEKMVT